MAKTKRRPGSGSLPVSPSLDRGEICTHGEDGIQFKTCSAAFEELPTNVYVKLPVAKRLTVGLNKRSVISSRVTALGVRKPPRYAAGPGLETPDNS
jgi:hypothetical protein